MKAATRTPRATSAARCSTSDRYLLARSPDEDRGHGCYEGGHSTPSFLGALGGRIGLFAQRQFQNRGYGPANAVGPAFFETEGLVLKESKRLLEAGHPLDLNWSMEKVPAPNAGHAKCDSG